jgi:serine/threonine protein kinase
MFVDSVSRIAIPLDLNGYVFQQVVKSSPTYVLFRALDEQMQPALIYFFETKRLDKLGILESVKDRLHRMKSMGNPNIASVIYVHSDDDITYMITNDYSETNLEQYVVSTVKLSENEVLRISKHLFEAFSYMHSKGVFHGGLTMESILFDSDMNPIISNFAFCQHNLTAIQTRDTNQTNFVPPEILTESSFDPFAADIWALGVVVYVMVSGKLPFDQKNHIKQINQMMKCNYTIPFIANQTIPKIINSCIVADPLKRTSAARITMELRSVKIEPISNALLRRGVTHSTTCIGLNFSKIESLAKKKKIQFRRKTSEFGFQADPINTSKTGLIKATHSTFF